MTDHVRHPRRRAFTATALPALAVLGLATAVPAQVPQYKFQPVLSFDYNSVGANPMGALALLNGSLYGTTSQGGTAGTAAFDGTVFRYTPGAGTIGAYAGLSGANGATPMAGLMALGGVLYGTASNGGDANDDGVVFAYNPATNTVFNPVYLGGASGSGPSGRLTVLNGTLYGTAPAGGANSAGTVFGVTPGAGGIASASALSGATNGENPQAGLAAFTSGGVSRLYGTAASGGSGGAGTVFEFTPGAGSGPGTFVATGFSGNGASPESGLALLNGLFYGTTQAGGSGGFGTIFQYSPTAHTITSLFSFSGANGAAPTGDLVFDGQGNLYGTTTGGGNGGDGTVFAFNPTTKALTTLVSFDDAAVPGSSPGAGLAFVGASLYGTTTGGGASGNGTLFVLAAPAPEPPQPAALGLGLLGLTTLRLRARRRGLDSAPAERL